MPPTPGQPTKEPMLIPLAIGLVSPDGRDLPLRLAGGASLKRGAVTIMRHLFVVIRSHGTSWDRSRPLEMQEGWKAHAQFMNALAAEHFVVVGGPMKGTEDTLLIIGAKSEEEIRRRLSKDPWGEDMLKISRIGPWSLRLGEHRLAAEASD